MKGQPIAVGGGTARGVVSAASYAARTFGVRSAMSGTLAAKLCPKLVFVSPRFDRYKEISNTNLGQSFAAKVPDIALRTPNVRAS